MFTMFTMSTIEVIYVVSSVVAAAMMFLCWTTLLNDLEKSFTNLKTERNGLKIKVVTLTANLEELESQKSLVNEISSKAYSVNAKEINATLVAENRKLHVRCDMLEEELNKIREKPLVLNGKKHV